jgi:hypothetical protein
MDNATQIGKYANLIGELPEEYFETYTTNDDRAAFKKANKERLANCDMLIRQLTGTVIDLYTAKTIYYLQNHIYKINEVYLANYASFMFMEKPDRNGIVNHYYFVVEGVNWRKGELITTPTEKFQCYSYYF